MPRVTRREFLARSAGAGAVGGVAGFGGSRVRAAVQESPNVVPSCRPIVLHDDGRFAYGQLLAGKISGGKLHGVELTRGADGKPVTRPGCLNVEHYYSTSQAGGRFVPRTKAPLSIKRLDKTAMRVEIGPYEKWRVGATVTYRLLPDCVIEADYVFAFDADYRGFEAFISNYFYNAWPPHLRLAGKWAEGRLNVPLEHHRWCRSDADRQRILQILPAFYAHYAMQPDYDLAKSVDETLYSEPVLVTFIGTSGYAVVHWIEHKNCPSISANRRWGAHDFSLIGRDVKRGESVRCRAWMAYRKLDRESLDDVLNWTGGAWKKQNEKD